MGRDSTVGIATRYGLDGPVIECRWGRDFPHPSRPALEAYTASCTMGTGSLPGGKAAGAWCWPPTPIYLPRSWKGRAIPLLTLWPSVACYRENQLTNHLSSDECNVSWYECCLGFEECSLLLLPDALILAIGESWTVLWNVTLIHWKSARLVHLIQ